MLLPRSEFDDGITLTWRNLSVYASVPPRGMLSASAKRPPKRIINDASGVVGAGQLVALMGPSGSGKSTLMSALANRTPGNICVDGEIRVNGALVGSYMSKISGFMHQEDLFVGALTVREHLRFMTWMKLGRGKGTRDVDRIVRDILVKVGLDASADARIGLDGGDTLLSGGERKKLSFATEMITNPNLFFCDEPTTGLDSYSAQNVVRLMKGMASRGKAILCTIHQPSSEIFDMFDHLILLHEGRIAFVGGSADAVTYFRQHGHPCPENYNPADFFARTLANGRVVARFCSEFAISRHARDLDDVIDRHSQCSEAAAQAEIASLVANNTWCEPRWTTKMYWLAHRSFLQVLRDPAVQGIRLVQKLGIALMAGLCFTGSSPTSQAGIQSVQGAVFLFVTENTFPGMYAVLSMFPQELPLFLREHRNGFYPATLYYASKMASLLPGLILDPFLFVLVFYWISGLRGTLYAFSLTALMAILTANVATACGSFFSNAFESVPAAMACLVPFDYLLMVTSGVFIKLESLPGILRWIRYLSWFMHSNEAIMIAQWDGVANISCEYSNPELPCISDGAQVLDEFGFSPSHLSLNITAIVVLSVAFHIFGCFFLWRKARARG